jgi:hypothetical protein
MTPFQFLNQYSFFVPFALLLLITSAVLALRRARKGWLLVLAGVVGLGIAALVLPSPRPSSVDVSSPTAIRAALANGKQPTLVHFHSHY